MIFSEYRHPPKISHTEAVQELLDLGLTMVGEYQGLSKRIHYVCSCGEIGYSLLRTLRSGSRCGKCHLKKYQDILASYGCKLISWRSSKDIDYRCYCGEIHTRRVGKLGLVNYICPSSLQEPKLRTQKLPVCSVLDCVTVADSLCKTTVSRNRPHLVLWKTTVLLRDNYTCQLCSKLHLDLHIHHIEAYSSNPELADVVTNGITLCKICHGNLHRKYGNNVGAINLAMELQ